MNYSGLVIDPATDTPLPGATVTLLNGNQIIYQVAAGALGDFNFNTATPITSIVISHAGYNTTMYPGNTTQYRFLIERKVATGDPVVIHSTKKIKWLVVLAIFGAAVILDKQTSKR